MLATGDSIMRKNEPIPMSHQTCRQCGHVFYFEDQRDGQTLRCPECRESTRLRVPETPADSVANAGMGVLVGFACLIGLKIVGLAFVLVVFLIGWPFLIAGGMIFVVSLIVNAFRTERPSPPKRRTKRTRIVEAESITSRMSPASESPPQEMYRFECPTCWTENVMTEVKRRRIAGQKFACRECGTVKRIPYPTLSEATEA